LKDYKKAHSYFQRALKMYADDAYGELGELELLAGNNENAIWYFQKAYDENPLDFENTIRLGKAYF